MKFYNLEDLEIDEKTKLLVKHIMKLDDEHSERLCQQLARMITLYYVREKELELEINFLEGRLYTIFSKINCLRRDVPGFALNEGKNETEDGLLHDSLCPLIEEINEKIRVLKKRKDYLWKECNCFNDFYEE